MYQFKKFAFFEKEQLVSEGAAGPDEKQYQASDNPELRVFTDKSHGHLTACTSGRGKLFFGSSTGVVAVLDRSLQIKMFNAHDRQVLHLYRMKKQDFLLSIGLDEEDLYSATIKIWKLSHLDGNNSSAANNLSGDSGTPQLVRSIKPFDQKFPEAPVMCFAVSEDPHQILLGLGDGAIISIEGDFIRNKGKTKRYLVKTGPCITGIHIVEESDDPRFKSYFFVTTASTIFSMIGGVKVPKPEVLDTEEGCDLNCSSIDSKKELGVARSQGIFFYQRNTMGGSIFFDEPKKITRFFNNYLVLVCYDKKSRGDKERSERNYVNIYDITNQLVAFSGKFESVFEVLPEWGSLFVVTSSGYVMKLFFFLWAHSYLL
jgi:hypothetical protein